MTDLAGRNVGNWIVGWGFIWLTPPVWVWSDQFSCLDPLHTFISCELKGNSLCSDYHCGCIDEDISIDCLSREVEVLVSLDEHSRHFVSRLELLIYEDFISKIYHQRFGIMGMVKC